ncbi:ABC transporter permease [Virgisporangium aliadipatigenens]|uniref:ABC transporter permease n=1 Tax=Virgisporangium aliadipatigenens TaxID=741659 RepID=A0A8J3YMP3_9ACTN|nr:ABC transporter permease subunit [Virgisporangium aliadipatigenens]GIJ48076.1 ABC transporter permease [Virgisporangium aliadipatigenens]
MTVFLKSLRDQRRGIIGWSVGIAALVLLESAMWPTVRDMPDLDAFVANYPEALRKLFDLDNFASGAGFINAELFSAVLPVLFIIFAVGRGVRLVAGEEEAGTLDIVLVTPVTPARFLAEQAAALATSLAALGVVLWSTAALCSAAFGLGVRPLDLAGACLSMVLLGAEFGALALAVGALTGRRAAAVAVPAVAAVAAYVLFVAGQLVDAVKGWQPLSPFHQALEGGPIGAGLPGRYLWLVAGAAAVIIAAAPVFTRRDIGAAR